ncbi:hypothetical protein HK405_007604, partial [Cladochytrium tenue]
MADDFTPPQRRRVPVVGASTLDRDFRDRLARGIAAGGDRDRIATIDRSGGADLRDKDRDRDRDRRDDRTQDSLDGRPRAGSSATRGGGGGGADSGETYIRIPPRNRSASKPDVANLRDLRDAGRVDSRSTRNPDEDETRDRERRARRDPSRGRPDLSLRYATEPRRGAAGNISDIMKNLDRLNSGDDDFKSPGNPNHEASVSEGGSRSRSIERNRFGAPGTKSRDRMGTLDTRSNRGAGTVDEDGTTAVGGQTSTSPRKRAGSVSSSNTAAEPSVADPAAISTMLPDAISDSKGYVILTPERIEDRRREFAVLSSQVSSLQNRLTLESRIREAALNVVKSTAPGDKVQAKSAQEQLASANKKVDAIATDLWKVTGKLMEVERTVLKHTAGVLRWGNINSDGKATAASFGTSAADKARLESSETKVKEYEMEISVLKSTVARLETENAANKRLVSEEQDNASRYRRECESNERLIRSLESEVKSLKSKATDPISPLGSSELNRVKLELATCRAELSACQEDHAATKEQLEKQQEQMEEVMSTVDEKDRIISNLLGELEEATNKLEMKTAANDALLSAGVTSIGLSTSPSTERQLRAQVAALEAELREATKVIAQGSSRSSTVMREQIAQQVSSQTENIRSVLSRQLKEAVGERERYKAQYSAERSKVADLEFEVEELKDKLGTGGLDFDSRAMSPRPRRGAARNATRDITNSTDLAPLEAIFPDLLRALSANSSDDSTPFSVDSLADKVGRLINIKKDLQRSRDDLQDDLGHAKGDIEKLQQTKRSLEVDLQRAKDESQNTFRDVEKSERELKSQLRAAERAIDHLKDDLEDAKGRLKLAESSAATEIAAANKKLDDAQAELKAAHARELATVSERAERRVREAERSITEAGSKADDEIRRKLAEKEKEWQDQRQALTEERDELKRKESELRSDLRRINERHQSNIDSLEKTRKKELVEAVDKERARAARVHAELDQEIEELQEQVKDAERRVESEVRRRISEELDRFDREVRRKLNDAEMAFRDQMKEAQDAFKDEMETAQLAHTDELDRLRDLLNREKRQELAALESRFNAEKAALENEKALLLADEAGKLKAKHQAAVDQLNRRHEDEVAKLKADQDATTSDLKSRLARSEATLLTLKSQFFEDREKLNETMEDLRDQLSSLRKSEQEAASAAQARQSELQATASKLRDELR